MTKHNPENERIKRKYLIFLKEAKRQNEASIDASAQALSRFDVYNKYRSFKRFHFEQAVGFKKHLAKQDNQRTGKKLSKSTLHSTLRHVKGFFQWFAMQPGYKSRIGYTDTEYFNPHSFRDTLAGLGEKLCQTPEDFKAWSQNLGHDKVLTTFYSYGEVQLQRQAEIIRGLNMRRSVPNLDEDRIAEAIIRRMARQAARGKMKLL